MSSIRGSARLTMTNFAHRVVNGRLYVHRREAVTLSAQRRRDLCANNSGSEIDLTIDGAAELLC